ncbi:NAC domain containing protein 50-like [Lycium barbarum]|uniref:NAC domain containing protein 50-like n=1 Tax=Lycium barbarum TaxID=112863 RepID=UPI00293E25F1|nr:NAC domain containing protein 50-like [Lycium barbarum]
MFTISDEKTSCSKNSAQKADGFRFHPTDGELMKYLLLHVLGIPYSNFVPIKYEDPYSKEPWVIFNGKKEKTLYFFTELKKKKSENTRYVRSVGKGSWKSQDKGKKVCSERGSLLGYKRSLRYQNSGSPQDGQWLMKEYSLCETVKSYLRQRSRSYNKDNYVLCRIKRKAAKDDPIAQKETIEVEELDEIIDPPHGSPYLSNDATKLRLANGNYNL